MWVFSFVLGNDAVNTNSGLGVLSTYCGIWRRPFAGLNKLLGWCISVSVTTRKTRNVIQGCGQGKFKSYFAQVPVVVSP